jgi:hypothetical protein
MYFNINIKMNIQQLAITAVRDININSVDENDIIAPDVQIGSEVYKWIISYTANCINLLSTGTEPMDRNDVIILLGANFDALVEANTYGKLNRDKTVRETILNVIYDAYPKINDFAIKTYDLTFRSNGYLNNVFTVFITSNNMFYDGQTYRDPRIITATWNINKAIDKVKYGGSILRLRIRWNQFLSILAINYPFKYQINTTLPPPISNYYDLLLLPGKFVINKLYTTVKYVKSRVYVYDAEYEQLDLTRYHTYVDDDLNSYIPPIIKNLPTNYVPADILDVINYNIKNLMSDSSAAAATEVKAGWLYRFHSNIDSHLSKSWEVVNSILNDDKITKLNDGNDEISALELYGISTSTFGHVGNTFNDEYVVIYIEETVILPTGSLIDDPLISERPEFILPCTVPASLTLNSQYNTAVRVRNSSLSSNLYVKYDNGVIKYEQRTPLFLVSPNYFKLSSKLEFDVPRYSVVPDAYYNVPYDLLRYLDKDMLEIYPELL